MSVLKACSPPSACLNHSILSLLAVISGDWLVGGLVLHPLRVRSLIWKVSTGPMLFSPYKHTILPLLLFSARHKQENMI